MNKNNNNKYILLILHTPVIIDLCYAETCI